MILQLIPAEAINQKYNNTLRSTNSGWHPPRHASWAAWSTQRGDNA
jgi:hypothetical protein